MQISKISRKFPQIPYVPYACYMYSTGEIYFVTWILFECFILAVDLLDNLYFQLFDIDYRGSLYMVTDSQESFNVGRSTPYSQIGSYMVL